MQTGIKTLKDFIKTCPNKTGVYRMLDKKNNILYIGKAKNLVKRLTNYVNLTNLSNRICTMVQMIAKIEIIVCRSEKESLLLEASLIKNLKPKFNILLTDDKSFPSILIRKDHDFGQILKHRGQKLHQGEYFGPFASSADVNKTIEILQKIFLLRTCSDNFFNARKRPCIQYQIKKCSAPCVGYISKEEYDLNLRSSEKFLKGKSIEIQQDLADLMNKESLAKRYEKAAIYRDMIVALNNIQAKNRMNFNVKECDIIAIYKEGNFCAIQIFFIRGGQNFGNKSYFPQQIEESNESEILALFIADFYQHNIPPKLIILNKEPNDKEEIEEIFKTKFSIPKTGDKAKLVDFALQNAKSALISKLLQKETQEKLFEDLANLFLLKTKIKRIDVFDNSHISGTSAIGAMIVATDAGFNKKHYRIFNIKEANTENDYDMMDEVLTRRYSKMIADKDHIPPDLIIIDGGPGHLSVANKVFSKLNINIPFVCIAKGDKRNAGFETIYQNNKNPLNLPNDNNVMQFLQRLRDEAHRFAIFTHRNKRKKTIEKSILDDIPNIGPKRKQILLNHFGSAKNVASASVEDLCMVKTIDKSTAEGIYNYFNN